MPLNSPSCQVPLDDEGDFPLQGRGLLANGAHELGRIKARDGAKQQRACGVATTATVTAARSRQLGCQWQHTLDVVFGLTGRVLRAGAQGQLQAKALRAQAGCQWAVTIHPRIGAAHMLFDCPAVGKSEGVYIQRHVPTGQHTEVNGFACDLEPQHRGVDALSQIKSQGCMRIHALAQGGRRWHGAQVQSTSEEGIFALTFDGIKVVLAQSQQTKVALQDVAVGNTRADREGRIDQAVDALEIFANQCQAGLVAQVVVQIFDDEIGHGLFTCWVKYNKESKLLISMGNQRFLEPRVTDSDEYIPSSSKQQF